MNDSMHIGKNIRTIRLLLGLKQELFALRLGIAQPNVSQLEKQSRISDDRLKEVAQALGVSAETIKAFNETALLEALTNPSSHGNVAMQDIINYYKEELARKDAQIVQLMSKQPR